MKYMRDTMRNQFSGKEKLYYTHCICEFYRFNIFKEECGNYESVGQSTLSYSTANKLAKQLAAAGNNLITTGYVGTSSLKLKFLIRALFLFYYRFQVILQVTIKEKYNI